MSRRPASSEEGDTCTRWGLPFINGGEDWQKAGLRENIRSSVFDMLELPATWWLLSYTGHIQLWKGEWLVLIRTDIYLRFGFAMHTCSISASIPESLQSDSFIGTESQIVLSCTKEPFYMAKDIWQWARDHGMQWVLAYILLPGSSKLVGLAY